MQHNEEMNSEVIQGREGVYDPQRIVEGNAKFGKDGLALGMHNVGQCEDAYMIQISLPGLRHLSSKINVNITKSGKVIIDGFVVDSKVFNEPSSAMVALESRVQELPLEGPFTLKYILPGPVDPRLFHTSFGDNGILSIVIVKEMKKMKGDQKSAA